MFPRTPQKKWKDPSQILPKNRKGRKEKGKRKEKKRRERFKNIYVPLKVTFYFFDV